MNVPVQLQPTDTPLPPVGLLATGNAAVALARRALELDDLGLAALRGVSQGRSGLALLGPTDALPWVDGVTYLCRDDDTPELLWPSAYQPSVAPAVLLLALKKALPRLAWPGALVLSGDGLTVWPLGHAVTVDRAVLTAWLGDRA